MLMWNDLAPFALRVFISLRYSLTLSVGTITAAIVYWSRMDSSMKTNFFISPIQSAGKDSLGYWVRACGKGRLPLNLEPKRGIRCQ